MAIEQNDNDDENQQNGPVVSTIGAPQAAPTGSQGAPTPAKGAPQGSGRYTNLQKYLQKNQGAGERLYSGIGNNLNQQSQADQERSQGEASKVAQGIQSSRENLTQGQGYQTQLQGPQFNAQQFVQDPNQLQRFTELKMGQGVNQQDLAAKNLGFQNANAQAMRAAQQRSNQVATEEGRFGLLKNSFGGSPQYSSGQQRLDQLFLQSGPGDQIKNLQNLTGQQIIGAQNLQKQAGAYGKDISDVVSQNQVLKTGLQAGASGLETSYIDQLSGKVAGVNTARDADRVKYDNFVEQLTGRRPAPGTPLDPQIFQEFQLQDQENVYNSLNDPNLNLKSIANVSDRNATDYRDVANQQDVDYYDALAKLKFGGLGADNKFQSDDSQKRLTKASDLEKAVQVKSGDGSLRNIIDKAGQQFLTDAQATTLTGAGRDSYRDMFGRGGEAWDYTSANLGDILNNVTNSNGQYGTTDTAVKNPTLDPLQSTSDSLSLVNSTMPFDAVGQLTGAVDMLTGNDGKGGAQSAARRNSVVDLQAQVNDRLKRMGYGNVLTRSGQRDTFDASMAANTAKTDTANFAKERAAKEASMAQDVAKEMYNFAGHGGRNGGGRVASQQQIDQVSDFLKRGKSLGDVRNLSDDDILKTMDYKNPEELYTTNGSGFFTERNYKDQSINDMLKALRSGSQRTADLDTHQSELTARQQAAQDALAKMKRGE